MPIVLSVVELYNAPFITSEEHLPPLFSTLYNPVNSEKSHSELLQLAVDCNQEYIMLGRVSNSHIVACYITAYCLLALSRC